MSTQKFKGMYVFKSIVNMFMFMNSDEKNILCTYFQTFHLNFIKRVHRDTFAMHLEISFVKMAGENLWIPIRMKQIH